jgi:hypothetical protein
MINIREVKDGDIITNEYGLTFIVEKVRKHSFLLTDQFGSTYSASGRLMENICKYAVSVQPTLLYSDYCDSRR